MPKPRSGCAVAMVVLGSAALVLALSWTFHFLPRWRVLVSSNIALELERRMEAYQRRFGTWPQGANTDILLALRGDNPGKAVFISDGDGFPIHGNAFADAWDHPFFFRQDADGRPRPVSPGPNHRPGDGDDIDSRLARADAEKRFEGKIPPWEPATPAAPNPPPR